MASENADIPRYLRYKAGGESADDVRDHELERANKILHNRIVRMHRDKLCKGCARFDWLRTHFYTREVRWTTEKGKEACQKIKIEEQQKPGDDLHYRDLKNVLDDVMWSQFEGLAGARREAEWLAKDPRFRWQLRNDQVRQCKLCNALWNHAEAIGMIPTMRNDSNSVLLTIYLYGGPVFEDGGKHKCIDAWPEYDKDVRSGTNGFKVYLAVDESSYSWTLFPCCIRPFIQETPKQPSESAHCCIRRRRVDTMVNFNLVTRWLEVCDETHEHTTSPAHSKLALTKLRFIDTQNRCVVERDHCVRYAALSYTWGQEKQYSLQRENIEVLERRGSSDRTPTQLKTVIFDAIEVCTKAGIPYLWVDALCIVQDDTYGKMSQIRHMDSIYSNAYITIVEAAEKQADNGQNSSSQLGSLGLSRVSTPFTPNEPCFTIDGISYLVEDEDIYSAMDRSFSSSQWSSRGWTFQELALSHRVLLFMAEEVVFYCSNGVLCESICLGDDSYRTLPLMNQLHWNPHSGIQICGFPYKLPRQKTTITDVIEQYEENYLQLLSFYIGRSLSYETDVLNAFSGIINAQSGSLGQFEAGLPLRLFARALFLSVRSVSGSLSRRRGFPSWSWIGWKLDVSAPRATLDDAGFGSWPRREYWVLVHIYSCTESRGPILLLGPLDFDNGIEGYCTRSIKLYNELTPAPPLPTLPCVEQTPFIPVAGDEDTQQLLVFWTHVARLDLSCSISFNFSPVVLIDCPKTRARFEEETILKLEVVLVAATGEIIYDEDDRNLPWEFGEREQKFSGIIIERWHGLARRIGVIHRIVIEQWVAAGPQKELLLLA